MQNCRSSPSLDASVPALVFKTQPNAFHHGTLGVIRSLGRLGVPVYAAVEDGFTPAALSRYLAGSFTWRRCDLGDGSLVDRLLAIRKQLGRPALLVPTDDLSAAIVSENAGALESSYLFPRPPSGLPRLLANKRHLHEICAKLGVPSAETFTPHSLEEVHDFIARADFPVMVKLADSHAIPPGCHSASIAHTRGELIATYRQTAAVQPDNLLFQEYIPEPFAEDWIFHGYANPHSGCLIGFTGRKLRSYPPFAGPTSLGVSVLNKVLLEQAEAFVRAIGYAGIMDLDYRFDKRDGEYKLLDFNPRIGANFRMFENCAGIDILRAMHMDLTGRQVPDGASVNGRKFIVESQDWFASLVYAFRGELSLHGWLESIRGERELAWFDCSDPAPALAMMGRLFCRLAAKAMPRTQRRPASTREYGASAALSRNPNPTN